MTQIIKLNGFEVWVEGAGFVSNDASDDFYAIVDELETYLKKLTPDNLAELTAGAETDNGWESSVQSLERLDRIASEITQRRLHGWHNPAGAFVTVSVRPV